MSFHGIPLGRISATKFQSCCIRNLKSCSQEFLRVFANIHNYFITQIFEFNFSDANEPKSKRIWLSTRKDFNHDLQIFARRIFNIREDSFIHKNSCNCFQYSQGCQPLFAILKVVPNEVTREKTIPSGVDPKQNYILKVLKEWPAAGGETF